MESVEIYWHEAKEKKQCHGRRSKSQFADHLPGAKQGLPILYASRPSMIDLPVFLLVNRIP